MRHLRVVSLIAVALIGFGPGSGDAHGRVWTGGQTTAQAAGADWDAALAAELDRRGAIAHDPYRCLDPASNPARQPCVIARSTLDEARRRLARFSVQSPADPPTSAVDTLARDGDGRWLLFLSAEVTPGLPEATYHLLQLPGALRPRAQDAEPLAVYAAPGGAAPLLGTLPQGAELMAEEFTLTSPRLGATPGAGFYRLSAPRAGRVSAYRVYDARQPDCFLRTVLEDGA